MIQEGHPACKKQWWGAGVVICLERGAADATATHCLLLQQNPDWFTFLVPSHPGSPGQMAVKRVCVCVCVRACVCVLLGYC